MDPTPHASFPASAYLTQNIEPCGAYPRGISMSRSSPELCRSPSCAAPGAVAVGLRRMSVPLFFGPQDRSPWATFPDTSALLPHSGSTGSRSRITSASSGDLRSAQASLLLHAGQLRLTANLIRATSTDCSEERREAMFNAFIWVSVLLWYPLVIMTRTRYTMRTMRIAAALTPRSMMPCSRDYCTPLRLDYDMPARRLPSVRPRLAWLGRQRSPPSLPSARKTAALSSPDRPTRPAARRSTRSPRTAAAPSGTGASRRRPSPGAPRT